MAQLSRKTSQFFKGLLVILLLFVVFFSLLTIRYDYFQLINFYYHAQMSNSHDLKPGNTITYLGFNIGQIDAMNIKDDKIILRLMINRDKAHLMREGSYLNLVPPSNLRGALFGASLVLVTNPNKKALPLPHGSTITVVEPEEHQLADAISRIQNQISSLVSHINRLFTDSNSTKLALLVDNIVATSTNIRQVSDNFIDVTNVAKQGFHNWSNTGMSLHNLINSTETDIAFMIKKLKHSSSQIHSVFHKAELGLDKSNTLMDEMEKALAEAMIIIQEAQTTLHKLNAITDKINNNWLFRESPHKEEESVLILPP